MRTVKRFANSRNSETRRQGTVPLPPLLQRKISSFSTGLEGNSKRWSKNTRTESSAIALGTFGRRLVRKQTTLDPRNSSMRLIKTNSSIVFRDAREREHRVQNPRSEQNGPSRC